MVEEEDKEVSERKMVRCKLLVHTHKKTQGKGKRKKKKRKGRHD